MTEAIVDVALRDATRRRYLNYALSVITSRALPDVRDGLKPVQRRILYAMYQDLRLYPDRKALKCAKVVGEVLGNYHPHGDSAVYDALVRMAQDFSLRMPLVDGHGNFGSIDGDNPAAYRYTEAKLRPFAMPLLEEIGQDTVDFRETFDAMRQEPIVLPAQAPVMLVNGATGIAVGIATNIPPHNLKETVDAAITLIGDKDATVATLMKHVKAPDFPTGGEIVNTRPELRKIYETGSGPVRMRATWKTEKKGKKQAIVIDSIPYQVKKLELAAKIRDLALDKKIPQIMDVRDESTTDIRVVLDLKSDAEPKKVMAYLFKATDLQSNFNANLTALVPESGTDVCAPRQLDLKEMLRWFLDFRFDVVKRRFEYELRELEKRLHILDGFAKIFNDLDAAIEIIRNSKDKGDARSGLIDYFFLDEIQANAILEMMLYRIASLEIKKIMQERREKRARAKEIREILASDAKLWNIVKNELKEIGKTFGEPRRSKIAPPKEGEEIEVSADDFIVDEDQFVTLTSGGRIKRVGTITSIEKISLPQGDNLLGVVAGSTKATVAIFSNKGVVYTARINDLPATRGHGDPIQKIFRFKDGERAIAIYSLDPRFIGNIAPNKKEDLCPEVHAVAVTTTGYGLRFALHPYVEPSTRVGRKFARVGGTAEVVDVLPIDGSETLVLVSEHARGLLCPIEELNFLEGAGKGVYAIKVAKDDRVLACAVTTKDSEGLTAVTSAGATHNINTRRYKVTSRAGKGFQIIKRGKIKEVRGRDLEIPTPR